MSRRMGHASLHTNICGQAMCPRLQKVAQALIIVANICGQAMCPRLQKVHCPGTDHCCSKAIAFTCSDNALRFVRQHIIAKLSVQKLCHVNHVACHLACGHPST